ncbi:MAG: hypothetical protein A2Z14_05050 [Chloroflexi bacterium RBG_16_48_8]|nr:MAG: hypothetical protein A2Z14_05050 [Chloroflexi bacterium RBG_16_48_8]
MRTGMLWFDNSPRSLKDKVDNASAYYQEKYGQVPTLCFVNPTTLAGNEDRSNGIEVREARTVRPDHFWIGVDQKDSANGNGNQL